MAFVGNKDGPRQSEIMFKLGAAYFGCSEEALEESISDHVNSEARHEVVPVNVDDDGQPYLVFLSPKAGEVQHFYLEKSGYLLQGQIATYTAEEKSFWEQRQRNEKSNKADHV